MSELISIIVPMYNIDSSIDKCLSSLQKQYYEHIEIIMVDDASIDYTVNIAQHFVLTDKRFKLIQNDRNFGAGFSRSRGINYTTGKYITFVDGDDIVTPYYIYNLYRALTDKNADIAISHLGIKQHQEDTRDQLIEVCNTDEILKKLFIHRITCGFVAKLFKKEVLLQTPISHTKYFEDLDFMYRCLLNVNVAAIYHAVDYFYIFRENSLSHSKFSKKQLDMFTICSEIVKTIAQQKSHLIQYAYFYNFLHLKYQLVTNVKYIGHYSKLFFKEMKKYGKKSWAVANRYQRSWLFVTRCGYTTFVLFRTFFPFIIDGYLHFKKFCQKLFRLVKRK